MENLTFDDFCSQVKEIMEGAAKAKGYSDGGVDGENQLDKFMEGKFQGHALGEAVYKCIRYRAKGNKEDLIKAAAWVFLEWRRRPTIREGVTSFKYFNTSCERGFHVDCTGIAMKSPTKGNIPCSCGCHQKLEK